MKATFIDTASHGYLSVSKKDLQAVLGERVNEITKYSGMNYTRVYLEEDQDAYLFISECEKQGIDLEIKHSYNPKHSITHSYNPDLINYFPSIGDRIELTCGKTATITGRKGKTLFIQCDTGERYKIPGNNPFRYISSRIDNMEFFKEHSLFS